MLPPDVAAAVRHFKRGGVEPDMMAVRARRSRSGLSQLFATDLADRGWRALPEPPTGWRELDVASGELLLAFCRHCSLAYLMPKGSAADDRTAARSLLVALAVERVWSNSTLHEVIDPIRLAFMPGGRGYSSSHDSTNATFEQIVMLEEPSSQR